MNDQDHLKTDYEMTADKAIVFLRSFKTELLGLDWMDKMAIDFAISAIERSRWVAVVYKDGTFKHVEQNQAWEYENDPDYFVTVGEP